MRITRRQYSFHVSRPAALGAPDAYSGEAENCMCDAVSAPREQRGGTSAHQQVARRIEDVDPVAALAQCINDLGFANVFPVALALYSRAAPKGLTGVLIGVFYLHLFAGNLLVGWLGGLLGTMPTTSFWMLHAGLVLSSGAVLLLAKFTVGRILAPAYDNLERELSEASARV